MTLSAPSSQRLKTSPSTYPIAPNPDFDNGLFNGSGRLSPDRFESRVNSLKTERVRV